MAQPERIGPTYTASPNPTINRAGTEPIGMAARDVIDNVGDLIRSEIRLAMTELKTAGTAIAAGAVFLIVSLAVIYLAVVFLLLAATAALATVVSFPVAALIVGVIVLILGLIAAWIGYSKIKSVRGDIQLDTTRETVREDLEWLKNRMK